MSLSNTGPGKSLSVSSNPQPVQGGPTTSSYESSRRPAALGSSVSYPVPRKQQASRKQHRNQRRPGAAGDGVSGNRGSSLDDYDAMAELRAIRNPSSRRGQTSITHLLDYSVPRPYQDHQAFARSYRRNPTWGVGSGYHAADKAKYVHGNYRFVVSPETTYPKQAADPDEHLDWSAVMQVVASAESQVASCPICLSEPVAPRMARCGHIFCLPCLIRFMHSASGDTADRSGKGARWKKCPICEDSVYLHEVRPVRFYAGQETPLPRTGDDVVLRLMARRTGSTLALPHEGGTDIFDVDGDIPWHFAANVLDYARVMKGTLGYMSGQFDEEIKALLAQEEVDENLFGQDREWSQKAINAVNSAKERLAGADGGMSRALSDLTSKGARLTSSADFYFYSAPPHLYLSPLDIRILKTKYGAFSSFPSTLLPRIEHISTGHVVDDALRRRAKYLGHLPHGCVISFLECDWTDIVPPDTLALFAEDIERRRKRNLDKSTQEERERAQAEQLEGAALRALSGVHRATAVFDEQPLSRIDPADFQPLGSQSDASPPTPRNGFDTLAAMSTSPSNQRTVWGTPAIPISPEIAPSLPPQSSDDGWLKDDELLLGSAELAMQMEAFGITESHAAKDMEKAAVNEGSGVGGGVGAGGNGKKKKNKKITLMSTGGRRGN